MNPPTSGWVIGSWFVPFINLWRPYQVVLETWNGSNPDAEGAPEAWRGKAPVVMVLWWTTWVAGRILLQFTMRIDTPSMPVSALEGGLTVASGIACVLMMRAIEQRQADLWARMSADRSTALRDQLAHAADQSARGVGTSGRRPARRRWRHG